MKTIQAHAHILTDKGANASGVTANLESYILSTRSWRTIATAKSNTEGRWQAKVARLLPNGSYAPILRLAEPGTPKPRVLAQGGYLSYNTTKKILTIDFGRIERLEETAYSLTASSSVFSRSKLTIAGQAKKANISITSFFREVDVLRDSRPVSGLTGATIATGAGAATIKRNPVLDNFDAEIIKFKATEASLQSTITKKDALLNSRNLQIKTFRTQVTGLEQKLAQSIAAEKVLKDKNQVFIAEAQRKTPIQHIAANIGNELDEANKKLHSEKRPYRFGRIELDLRGTVSSDGQSMALASLVDLKAVGGSAALPGMKVEILPDSLPTEVTTDVTVPDVTGLTETVVRRLLHAVGLRLKMVSKSVESASNIPIGQSIQQSPKAGSQLARSENVLVVFASPSTNLEDIT